MKKIIYLLFVSLIACKDEPVEPKTKPCDTIYTEIVAVRCCGMTGPGGLSANSDCASYSYCVEYYICEKP